MEIAERLFQVFAKLSPKAKSAEVASNRIESLKPALEKFATFLMTEPVEVEVVPSLGYIGFQESLLHIPVSGALESCLNESEIESVYFHLVMLIVEARNLGFKSKSTSYPERKVEFLERLPLIRRSLNERWPNHREIDLLIRSLTERARSQGVKVPSSQVDWLLFVPSLELDRQFTPRASPGPQQRAGTGKNPSEREKPHTGEVEEVDLKKEQVNPVLHSFEKMETVDEYKGGRKVDNGDDELNQQADALKEIDLSQMTRDGATVSSFYSGPTLPWLTLNEESLALTDHERNFTYPEWSSHKNRYLKDHCQLFEHSAHESSSSHWRHEVFDRNRLAILRARQVIKAIHSEPLWQKRRRDGSELDLDNFIREWPDLQLKRPIEGKWYAEKRRLAQSLAVSILIDQSMSSDAWVAGQRVLDVILESVAIAGLIVEENLSQFEVFGTWTATRHSCNFVTYKAKNEPWEKFFARKDKIEPSGYTRLGPALRHVAMKMSSSPAKKRLMLILTDGKPTDLDGYEGHYGIADVKRACLEAELEGIWPYALTIDERSKQHFPKMFSHYRLLSRPDLLAENLVQILLQLMERA